MVLKIPTSISEEDDFFIITFEKPEGLVLPEKVEINLNDFPNIKIRKNL